VLLHNAITFPKVSGSELALLRLGEDVEIATLKGITDELGIPAPVVKNMAINSPFESSRKWP
jgi:hypothetical protein